MNHLYFFYCIKFITFETENKIFNKIGFMRVKTFFALLKSKFFWRNIAVAIIIFIALWLLTFVWLKHYTHHDENIEVPPLSGLYVEEAEVQLQKLGLNYEIIDSVYSKKNKPGEIMEQKPIAGTLVKEGRKIYITTNAKNPRKIEVPDLRNISFRQAKFTLQNMGFGIGDIEYKPSEYSDLVLDLKFNGEPIAPGTKLNDGSVITLVVGKYNSNIQAIVPSLHGLTLAEARDLLSSSDLAVGSTNFDVDPADENDMDNYFVYHQSPEATKTVTAGKHVDIWLSKDKSKTYQEENKNSDEVFF